MYVYVIYGVYIYIYTYTLHYIILYIISYYMCTDRITKRRPSFRRLISNRSKVRMTATATLGKLGLGGDDLARSRVTRAEARETVFFLHH